MQFFLKAKAWQIFLLSFGIPCGLVVLASFLTRSADDRDLLFFLLMAPTMGLFLVVLLAWYWSLGRLLNQSIGKDIRPKDTWFRRGLIYVSIYMTIFLSGWAACGVAVRLGLLPVTTTRLDLARAAVVILVLCHLLAMAAMIYVLYFVARSVTMVEEGSKKPSGKSTAGDFLLLWFFPIGVWFIQPMVNRMWRDRAI